VFNISEVPIRKLKEITWECRARANSFKKPSNITSCKNTEYVDNNTKIDFASNVIIYFENKRISFTRPLLHKNNRYYLPIIDFIKILSDKVESTDEITKVFLEGRYIVINWKEGIYEDGTRKCFRNHCSYYDNVYYLSVFDLTQIFNLKIVWHCNVGEIRLFRNREKLMFERRLKLKRPSLIRLEDITAGSDYANCEDLEKLRIIGDFLYSKSIPFHIAWIPRYKNPKKGINNNLLLNFNLYNADFIFTLDYLLTRDGIIGLHGFTHQYKDGESGVDTEFGEGYYSTPEEARERVIKAIDTAKKLNIPYKFFESPHYSCTEVQQAVFEEYFHYIFEPGQGMWNKTPVVSPRNKRTIYVPAPLGYVHDMDIDDMLERIKNNYKCETAALFYHPYKEFQDIELIKSANGYPAYNYSEASFLHKIVRCLNEEGYSQISITDITF
jgi:uncharacterized protein YdaL